MQKKNNKIPKSAPAPEDPARLATLQKRLTRERSIRKESEALAEAALADLYAKQQELHASQRDLKLLQEIAMAANAADTLQEALRSALTLVCEHMGWPVGHAFLQGSRQGERFLESAKVWYLADTGLFSLFRQVTEQTHLTPGMGLPGRVLASGEPAWITDINLDDNFPRLALCGDLGLRAGMAFPVLVGSDAVAVLEFFSEEPHAPTDALLDLLANLGTQLGRVFERDRAREAIQWQAYHDSLTDLPNRSLFQDRLSQAVSMARRQEHGLAVVFIDIDRFKPVNDTLGHASGDRLLAEFARRLARRLRPEDTLARVGADEFAILLPTMSQAEGALKVAQDLLAGLSAPILIDNHELFVSASVGVSLFPGDGADAESLLRHADVAMFRTKQQGGARAGLYAQEMDSAAQERLSLETSLRQAIVREEMVVYYQPLIDLATGRVLSVEALLRWPHPTMGLVSPMRFIPLAEETGLILPLGQWVLESATKQTAAWHRAGHPVRVAINLSARQFERRDVVQTVASAIEISGLPAEFIELELTESTIMARGEGVVDELHALKKLGVRIAVDDFGTGYSSLAYLRRFPVDILKIDRSFMRGLGADRADEAIIRTVVNLAHALGLEVVAEGVETEEQHFLLEEMGCDLIQGFLFSPPKPVQEAQALLGAAWIKVPRAKAA